MQLRASAAAPWTHAILPGSCRHALDPVTCPVHVAAAKTLAVRRARGRPRERKLVVVAPGPLEPPQLIAAPTSTMAFCAVALRAVILQTASFAAQSTDPQAARAR